MVTLEELDARITVLESKTKHLKAQTTPIVADEGDEGEEPQPTINR